MLGFSAVAVAWASFTGTAYAADAAPTAPPATSSVAAPDPSTAGPLGDLTGHLTMLLGDTTTAVGNALTTVTTAPAATPPTAPSVPAETEKSPQVATQQPEPVDPAPISTPHVEVAPTRTPPASGSAGQASTKTDAPAVYPLLGNATQAMTTKLTGAVTSTVDQAAAPGSDLLKSLLDTSPVPAVIDSTPVVGTTIHDLADTTAKTVHTLTGLVDHGVSPTLGLLGIGVAPVQDTVDDIVTPAVTPLSSQTDEPATPVRPAATLPLGPPATSPPVIPGVVAIPTAPPKSSAIHLRTPRTAKPVPSGTTSRLSSVQGTGNTTTGEATSTPSVATADLDGLLGTPGAGLPDQPSSNAPTPGSTGGLGNAAPVIGTASTDTAGRPLEGISPRDHAWRLPVAPSREPGARPD